MEVEYAYQMRGLQDVLDAIRALDSEPESLLAGLAVVLLIRDNGEYDWYAYTNLENPAPADRSRITAVLTAHGTLTDFSLSHLRKNPHLGFIGSGAFDQIILGLQNLASKADERGKREILTALAQSKPTLPI